MNKPKMNRFRVRTSGGYCSLNKQFHDQGVIIPDATQATAYVYKTKAQAQSAIDRTIVAQKSAKMSMFPEFPVFKKLDFVCDADIESFQTEE